MKSIYIRKANITDADIIGAVGPAAYLAAYKDLWDKSDAFAVQLQTFGATAVSQFLARADCTTWVACQNDTVVGFLTMDTNSADPISDEPDGVEIPRIYLLPDIQGYGVGKRLYDVAEHQARFDHKSYVWLDAMALATKVIDVYKGWGFEEIGTTKFDAPVREDANGLVVLRKQL